MPPSCALLGGFAIGAPSRVATWRCYGNVTRTPNVSEYMLVLVLCLVRFVMDLLYNKLYNKILNKSTTNRRSTINPKHLDMSRCCTTSTTSPQRIYNKSKQRSFDFDLLWTCCSTAANHGTDHSNEAISRTYDVDPDVDWVKSV